MNPINRQRRAVTGTLAALAGAVLCQTSSADTLHATADGAYWHHFSGWIFPARIGEFQLDGPATDVDGTEDVTAHYLRGGEGGRFSAIVDVYPPDSYAAEASMQNARKALTSGRSDAPVAESQLVVGTARPLTAIKLSHSTMAADQNGTAVQKNLYFVDTGEWIIKIRTEAQDPGRDSEQIADAFARGLHWETLELPEGSCGGPACRAPSLP